MTRERRPARTSAEGGRRTASTATRKAAARAAKQHEDLKRKIVLQLLDEAIKQKIDLKRIEEGLKKPDRVRRALTALISDPPPPRELDWSDSERVG